MKEIISVTELYQHTSPNLRYCRDFAKLLSILAMTGHVHQNWYYEPVRKFDVYLHTKN